MRIMILMTAVPGSIALLVGPEGDEPEAFGLVAWVEDRMTPGMVNG